MIGFSDRIPARSYPVDEVVVNRLPAQFARQRGAYATVRAERKLGGLYADQANSFLS
jgi:hypothetical protein